MQRALSCVLVVLFVLFVFLPADAEQEGGQGYFDLGVFAYEDGDYKSAESHFKKALEFNPDNPFYNHFMGKTYLKTADYQAAKNYLNMAWKLDPDISGLKYDLALLNYKMSDYSKAADLFMEIVNEEPSNVLAHYHAGICLYKQRKYGKALDYFLAAARMSPTIKVNGYYYAGVCYWKMGKTDEAVQKLEYVRDHADSELLRENALIWLKIIEEEGKKALRPYSLFLEVGYGYDDNVTLEPLDEDIFTEEDDYFTMVHFSGRYNFVNRTGYKMGVGYSHYQTWHNDLEEYDLTGSILSIYGTYRLHPFTLGLSYVPSYYWLDEDSYLRRHKLRPEVIWTATERLAARLSYSYNDNEYFQEEDRDGLSHDVFLDAYYSILDERGHLFGGIGYEDNHASHSDQDYGRLTTRLGLILELPWELELGLTGRYQDKQYDNVDTFYGKEREDDQYHGAVSLARKLFYDWLSVLAEYSYTKNESNISDYEYNKSVAALCLRARY
jgi:tetratricopeptide (TPR) repeat protein